MGPALRKFFRGSFPETSPLLDSASSERQIPQGLPCMHFHNSTGIGYRKYAFFRTISSRGKLIPQCGNFGAFFGSTERISRATALCHFPPARIVTGSDMRGDREQASHICSQAGNCTGERRVTPGVVRVGGPIREAIANLLCHRHY